MPSRRPLAWVLLTLTVLSLDIAPSAAQTLERGQLRGVVSDDSRAVLPGASVTLTHRDTGRTWADVTDAGGTYQFSLVPTGRYTLTAVLTGFAPTTITDIVVNVGAGVQVDVTLHVAGTPETVEVAAAGASVAPAAGISQLIDSASVSKLPLSGRDYRDLAQLSSSALVVPGMRGGIRLGGQQSDYTGLVIDGGDAVDNFFGEFFGSLETKNFTVPLDAVAEFQVVTNGFAPEFGRSTGGLINVVTKSGTNTAQALGHYVFRGRALTAHDALGTPPNIDAQHQFGGALGFPIARDRQFAFLAADRQLQHGPLTTRFAREARGIAVPELGIGDLSSLEGPHRQFQNLFTVLGRYDAVVSTRHAFSGRTFFSRNATDGFTGGRGQNLVSVAFDNTERFLNQGHNSVAALTSTWARASHEIRALYSYQIRPRDAQVSGPEVIIDDTGILGQRYFLPINGDNEKLQLQDNVVLALGSHDIKFGGDVNLYALKKNLFVGWDRGSYYFGTLEDFAAREPYGFIQGFGLNGLSYLEAGTWDPAQRQTGMSLYWQDKWQLDSRTTLTYGLRWDGTINPVQQSATTGERVYVGVGAESRLERPLQRAPRDLAQFGPRAGLTRRLGDGPQAWVVRAAWGLYYAPMPTIFLPFGSERTALLFCFTGPSCLPPGGFPQAWPNTLQPNDPLLDVLGPPAINYIDSALRNPRVSNTTLSLEIPLAASWHATISYAHAHSDFLRVGGFFNTLWERNLVVDHVDEFGRSHYRQTDAGPERADPTIGSANALGSFGRGNFQQVTVNVTKRYSSGAQFFANYAWSRSRDNASSERDTDTYFGPQDAFNLELDYGRTALDIPHQLKFAGLVDLPGAMALSGIVIARSGTPYPAYVTEDLNGDGVFNTQFSNDRPTLIEGGRTSLLERYPGRQPHFFQTDVRLSKTFTLPRGRRVEAVVEAFNVFDTANLYSNPNNSAFVDSVLTRPPRPGDRGPRGTAYRTLDQISPGSTPRAVQLGLHVSF